MPTNANVNGNIPRMMTSVSKKNLFDSSLKKWVNQNHLVKLLLKLSRPWSFLQLKEMDACFPPIERMLRVPKSYIIIEKRYPGFFNHGNYGTSVWRECNTHVSPTFMDELRFYAIYGVVIQPLLFYLFLFFFSLI